MSRNSNSDMKPNAKKRSYEGSYQDNDSCKKPWIRRSPSHLPNKQENKIKEENEETKKDLTVVRNPTELAAITDPLELQKMGYDFMVAASKQLHKERESLQEQVSAYKILIQKQVKDLEKEKKSAEIKYNIYEKVIATLREQKQELECDLTKKIGELEEKIDALSNANESQKKETLRIQDELKERNDKVEELTCKVKSYEDQVKEKETKLSKMPAAIHFFLQRYIGSDPLPSAPNDQVRVKQEQAEHSEDSNSTSS